MPSTLHASCFREGASACLLLGPAGSGKSTLLAQLLLHGATLVADDQVELYEQHGQLIASPPATLAGILELHGLGLIRHLHSSPVPISLAVQLGTAGERLPAPEKLILEGIALPLLRLDPAAPGLAAKLLLYLRAMQEHRILAQDWHPTAK